MAWALYLNEFFFFISFEANATRFAVRMPKRLYYKREDIDEYISTPIFVFSYIYIVLLRLYSNARSVVENVFIDLSSGMRQQR